MEDPSCPFCTEVNEDLDHLFIKCTKVILVWKYVDDNINKEAWANLLFKDWVRWNLKSKVHGNKGPWKESFALCLWLIWRWRNNVIFNGKEISMNRKAAWIASYIQEIMSAFSNQAIACRGKFKSKMNWIGWRHPPPGWVKLSVDESTLKEFGIVRARGAIRDAIG